MPLWSILSETIEVLRSFRGALLVQLQSVGLWEGRQFRQYFPFAANAQIRFNAARPFILSDQSLYANEGSVQVQILTGSTPAGTWTNTATQQAKNRYSPKALLYTQQCFMQSGGTFTGGTERELIRANAGVGQGNASRTVDSNVRVLPAGIYYFNITITGTTTGLYSFEWEEL